MTLGDAKRKALKLMDEYSANGQRMTDADIALLLTDFFDTAQKNLAQLKKIPREYPVPVSPSEDAEVPYPMPEDFLSLRRVRVDGREGKAGRWLGSTLYLPGDETRRVTVEYNAWPKTIPEDAKEGYKFEIAPDAQECMPYWVAAQVLVMDAVNDYTPLLDIYNRMVAVLDTAQPGSISFVKAARL